MRQRAALVICAAFVALLSVGMYGNTYAGGRGPASNFIGADDGVPIDFEVVALPAIIGDAAADISPPLALPPNPFTPTLNELVSGETVITTTAQMRYVWARLFGSPYDSELFDFENTFVVLMGNGLQHPDFGFEITNVEQFDANFLSDQRELYVEQALAVVATEILPGPPPEPADPVYQLAAVKIDKKFFGDVIFSRQIFAAP